VKLSMALSMALVAIMFGIAISGQASQLRSEEELKLLKSRIVKLQAHLQTSRREEQSVIRDLDNLERKSTSLAEKQLAQNQGLESLKAHKSVLQKKLLDLGLQDEDTRMRMREVVRSSYVLGQQDSIKLLLNQKDPMNIARTLSLYRYFVSFQGKQIEKVRQHQQAVRNASAELERKQLDIEQALANIDISTSALRKTEQVRREQLGLVQQALFDGQTQVEVFQKREAELEQLLRSLQREKVQKYQNKLKPVASASDETRDQSAGKISRKNTRNQLVAGGFSRQKGRLEKPAAAMIQNRYGQVKPESGLTWEGLMFDVKEGQSVSAIYSGQVVFSDWFRGYGQLLVLDHGDGYMSLYGHNQLIHVELGSAVEVGQLVAFAGSTGGLVEPGLYFEIRHNGSPDDPSKWLRL